MKTSIKFWLFILGLFVGFLPLYSCGGGDTEEFSREFTPSITSGMGMSTTYDCPDETSCSACMSDGDCSECGKSDRGGEKWRGLTVEEELQPSQDCSTYREEEYTYQRDDLLDLLIDRMEGIYSPYTRRVFSHNGDVDIEHIVSRKQAHYSGLCQKEAEKRTQFASDLINLTLAGSGVNRAKGECDAATWIPPENRCWFAARVVEVRHKYGLSIDRRESDALESILSKCPHEQLSMNRNVKNLPEALKNWDSDDNGQISCAELEKAGVKTPISHNHEAYPFVKDGNCDGTTC